jgi:glycosyltransferase involved in cell wall biosynthesis
VGQVAAEAVNPRAPRLAVVIPCHNDGSFLVEALDSIREAEPVDVVVVDDASTDAETIDLLPRLEARHVRLCRHPHNRGLSEARMTGLRATEARYVFPLDADDLLVPGALGSLADLLDAEPSLAACYGDYAEFGFLSRVVRTPPRLDPYRLAFRNEYPVASLFRRSVLEDVGGWRDVEGRVGYEDWHLWMELAERGYQASHIAPGTVTMRRRVHSGRMLGSANKQHRQLYGALRRLHPGLFDHLPEHRRSSTLGPVKARLYPLAFGARRRRGVYTILRRMARATGLMYLRESWQRRRGKSLGEPASG